MRGKTEEKLWCRVGDAGRILLVGGAIAAPLRKRDFDRSFDTLSAVLATAAACKFVKAFWHEPRPNGEDSNSFPSQHAAECFAAAQSLDGALNGRGRSIALALAGGVALTRVLARKHRLADVIAGGAMGITAASLRRRT